MIYEITFLEQAYKEWKKLANSIRQQFINKLDERRQNPHVQSAKLSGLKNCYKIKLKSAGYRLIYRVYDDRLVIQIIAIGKRDKNEAYEKAHARLHDRNHTS